MKPLMLTISAGEWEGINHRPHHFMRRCADSGWTVVYLEPPASLIAPLKDKRFLKRWSNWRKGLRKYEANLYVLAPPPVLPFGNKYRTINRLNQWLISRTINRALKQFPNGGRNRSMDVFTFLPSAVDLLPLLKHNRVIYDCVDDHAAFTGLIDAGVVHRMERELMSQADVCFATARRLYEDRKDWSDNFHIIPNGAEFERFACVNDTCADDSCANDTCANGAADSAADAAAVSGAFTGAVPEAVPTGVSSAVPAVPEDMADLQRPIVGFVGGISDWVDVGLMADVAEAMPEVNFVLIGPALTDVGALESLDNVRLLGPKPYTSLPEYVKGFDVCLIPFKINKLTESVNPIKMFEYLAAGKPVVSTPLPEVAAFSEVVTLADGVEETVNAIMKALEPGAQSEASIRRRQQVAKENSWDARWKAVMNLIEGAK